MTAPLPELSVRLAGKAIAQGGPTGSAPLAVDELVVTWGRAGLLEQPELSTAKLTLFDPTRAWHNAQGDLIGQVLDVGWDGRPFVNASAPGPLSFFRGRITEATVRRETLDGVDGSIVTLAAGSILGDLANRVPRSSWPAENIDARAARIAAAGQGPGLIGNGVTGMGAYSFSGAAPVALADQVSILDHLRRLYDSLGAARMAHDVVSGTVAAIPRRLITWRGLTYLTPGDDGWRIVPYAVTPSGTSGVALRYPGLTLDGVDQLDYDDETIARTVEQRISTVQASYKALNASGGYDDQVEEVTVAGADPTTEGDRIARVDTIHAVAGSAQRAANNLADLVAREGRAWQVGRLGLAGLTVTDWTDAARLTLLAGTEVPTLVLLARSFLPELGVRPVVAIAGGVIRYADGAWSFGLDTLPVATTARQHAIAAEDLPTGALHPVEGVATTPVVWDDLDNPHPRGLHPTVTWGDLEHVAAAHPFTDPYFTPDPTAIPSDLDWDTYR